MKAYDRRRFARSTPPTGFAVGRSRWRDLLAEAKARAVEIIAAEGGLADPLGLSTLRRAELQTGKLSLPAEILGSSAAHAQIAFAATLKGMLAVELEPRRLAFARLTLEAVRLVEQLLDEAAAVEAERTWRRQEPD